MALEDLMKAFETFGRAANDFGIQRGIEDATNEVNRVKKEELDVFKQREAQTSISNQLQGRLAGLGASGQQIAAAVGSVAPEQLQSASDYARKFQETGEQKYADAASKMSKTEGIIKRDQEKPSAEMKFGYDKQLAIIRNSQETKAMTADQQRKWAEKSAQLEIPGFVMAGKTRPLPTEAAKLRDGTAVAAQMNRDLEELDRLMFDPKSGSGSFEFGGKKAARIEALATGLRLSAKEAENLGVLNGKDYEIITEQIPETSSISSMFSLDSSVREKLTVARERAKHGPAAQLAARGYISDEDHAAMEWVTSNPTDPRAAGIRERLTSRGIK